MLVQTNSYDCKYGDSENTENLYFKEREPATEAELKIIDIPKDLINLATENGLIMKRVYLRYRESRSKYRTWRYILIFGQRLIQFVKKQKCSLRELQSISSGGTSICRRLSGQLLVCQDIALHGSLLCLVSKVVHTIDLILLEHLGRV